MRRYPLYLVASVLVLAACSVPPPLQKGDLPSLFAPLFSVRGCTAVVASGEVKVCIDGETHTGSVDVGRSNDGRFEATFYGPFGMTLGSIRATADSGTATFDQGAYALFPDRTMGALPFTWGSDLTFGELEDILVGGIPVAYASRLLQRPDSIIEGRRTISALWKTDTVDVRAEVHRRSQQIVAVTLVLKKRVPFPQVAFGSFKEGRAHKIELRENDRNYFLLRYTKVK
jgi:hypothetical protein